MSAAPVCRAADIMAHHDVMAADELDDLYGVNPDEFTARRAELAAAAKKRGDGDEAKRISAARRPTTAAWVVNLLALRNADVKHSLTDLRERLRAAHAAMDGSAIRELSAEQRNLVEDLTRAAFQGADVANPSTTMKEDVAGTLQAAIADPDVAERLGHLAKAERWSGFGDFGTATAVFTTSRSAAAAAKVKPQPEKAAEEEPREHRRRQAREVAEGKAALAAAEQAKADADDEISKRQTDLAVARLRRDEMRRRLEEAERNLTAAEGAYDDAKRASRDAAGVVEEAKSRLTQSRRAQ
jgi:hypothetical protein